MGRNFLWFIFGGPVIIAQHIIDVLYIKSVYLCSSWKGYFLAALVF